MRLIGERHTYPDGTQVVRNGHASGTIDSIHDELERADIRSQEASEAEDAFIPSDKFVGAEQPLARAMRQLVTDGFGRR